MSSDDETFYAEVKQRNHVEHDAVIRLLREFENKQLNAKQRIEQFKITFPNLTDADASFYLFYDLRYEPGDTE